MSSPATRSGKKKAKAPAAAAEAADPAGGGGSGSAPAAEAPFALQRSAPVPAEAAAAAAAAAAMAAAATAAAAVIAEAKAPPPAEGGKAPPAEKRRPGRPPSLPPPPPMERRGVVDAPANSRNRFEFVYERPGVFRELFTHLKNARAREVFLRLDPQGLAFFARDHGRTSRIVALIPGAQVNWHYCEGTFVLGLKRETAELAFAPIDKTHSRVTLAQSHDDLGRLTITLHNAEVDTDRTYMVALAIFPPDPELFAAERDLTPESLAALYPVQFTLTARYFKKLVGDAATVCAALTLEKLGRHPLQYTYASSSVQVGEVFNSRDMIDMRSSVGDDAIFRVRVGLANLKALAAAMVTDNVRVLCREDDDLLVRSVIDSKALVVSTFLQTLL